MPSTQGGNDSKRMEVTQINLNHCDTAQNLMWQAAAETKCDVLIIAEPYYAPIGNGNWTIDKARTAAIWVCGRYPIQEVVSSENEGFVVVKINGIYFCSCYAPPRGTLEEFERMLDIMTQKIVGRKPVVIGGDLNAWAVEWGSKRTNARGQAVLEAFAKLDVSIANQGSTSTFRRNGRESIIDITFCSQSLIEGINWRVCNAFTYSHHQANQYTVGRKPEPTGRERNPRGGNKQWRAKELDKELLGEAFGMISGNRNEMSATELTDTMTRACDVAMPRKLEPRDRRRPAYWWCDELGAMRSRCLRARRAMQRARNQEEREERRETLRELKLELKRAIATSKRERFKELLREVEDNPWGNAYRIITTRLKGPVIPRERCRERMKTIER